MCRLWSLIAFSVGVGASLLLVAGTMGCGSSPTAPTPIPITTYQGNWFGTTSDGGLPISFAVSGNAITSISFSYNLAPNDPIGCGGNLTGALQVAPPNPLQIANGGFSTSGIQQAVQYTVAGTFGSATSISGTISLGVAGLIGCSWGDIGTWSATKRP